MTTLEKIRVEIADNHDFYFFAESNKDIALGLEYALEIIDKYAEQEPCDDAISREAAITIAGTHTLTVDETVKALERLPSVRPQEPQESEDKG